MRTDLPRNIDKPTFLAWVQRREGRYELVDGCVVATGGATRGHATVVGSLASLMTAQLDERDWTVLSAFGLDVGPRTLRFPDIVVDRTGGAADDYTATAPTLLVEVLAPSTAEVDLGDKAAEYLRLPSLSAYLVLAQDEPKAWIWVRGSSGFSPGPDVIAGPDGTVRIPALRIDLPLANVYRRIARTDTRPS